MSVTMSGDPRQVTFSTTASRTNRKWSGYGVATWLEELEEGNVLTLEEHNSSRPCVQELCNFGDSLFPELAATVSLNGHATGHDGLFFIRPAHVAEYVREHSPQLLIWSRASQNFGCRRAIWAR